MANSISAEVWLDERRWDALEVVLEEQGSNIEQHLQEYLLDLYREMVPPDQVREIESDIQKEALETQREREARKVFSAFRLWENGKSRCLATEYPKDFLDTARLLRKHLLEKAGGADDFARKINGGYDISLSRFEELTLWRGWIIPAGSPACLSWILTDRCSPPPTFWTAGKAIGSRM